MTTAHYVPNILNVFANASEAAYTGGMEWYHNANAFARTLDNDIDRASAVIAILSAGTSWAANVTLAKRVFMQSHGGKVGFKDKTIKINRIFAGESPASVVSGPKVTAFYQSILNPDSPDNMPVIDRHAQDIADGAKALTRNTPKGPKYVEYCNAYIEAAHSVGIMPKQMQAVTWESWREVHGMV